MPRTENIIHPGEILLEEFLKPMGISQTKLAIDIRIPASRIQAIVSGARSITADTALRLGKGKIFDLCILHFLLSFFRVFIANPFNLRVGYILCGLLLYVRTDLSIDFRFLVFLSDSLDELFTKRL